MTSSSNASDYVGTWTGTWTNTTFSSTGGMTVTIADNSDGTFDVTVDLDGNVGGQGDPAPQTITVAVANDGTVTFSDNILMGLVSDLMDVNVSSTGDINVSIPSIPLAGFTTFSATGTINATDANVNYTVNFSPSGSAVGTVTATKS